MLAVACWYLVCCCDELVALRLRLCCLVGVYWLLVYMLLIDYGVLGLLTLMSVYVCCLITAG